MHNAALNNWIWAIDTYSPANQERTRTTLDKDTIESWLFIQLILIIFLCNFATCFFPLFVTDSTINLILLPIPKTIIIFTSRGPPVIFGSAYI